jgi:hypothetical protein
VLQMGFDDEKLQIGLEKLFVTATFTHVFSLE